MLQENEVSLEEQIKNIPIRDQISYIKRIEIRDTMIEFATKYHVNTNGAAMRFDTFPHMTELYETGALYQDDCIIFLFNFSAS